MKKLHKIRTYNELLLTKEKVKYALLYQERELGTAGIQLKYEIIDFFKGTIYEIGQKLVSYLIVKLVKRDA